MMCLAVELQSLRAGVKRLRADQAVLGVLLHDVAAPAGDAAAGEHGDELVRLETDSNFARNRALLRPDAPEHAVKKG